MQEVKTRLASEYPGNYSLQNMLLDRQKEDYEYLRRMGTPYNMLHSTFEKIKDRIKYDYPYNYITQRMFLDKQLADRKFIEDYSPRDCPFHVVKEIKRKYESQYPYDFSMRKLLIVHDVNSYIKLNR